MPGVVQISCLGSLGRFGNQLFQYACAKGYARKYGLTLETPPSWIGRQLFEGCADAVPVTHLSQTPMDVVPDGESNINLCGYFQHAEAFRLYTFDDLRTWFTFKPWVHEALDRTKGRMIAAHLRRGDYATQYANIYCTIDAEAYSAAALKAGYDPNLIHWVREDQSTVFNYEGLEWLEDFMTLYHARILFRANSTFSWWAATLGNHEAVYSPVVTGLRGHQKDVQFVRGNWPRCCDQPNVSDYYIL